MTEAVRDRRNLAQEFLSLLSRPDVARATEMLSPGATYQVLGLHALAGNFSTPAEIVEHLDALANWTSGTFDATKWEDWLVGEEYVGCVARIHMQAEGRIYSGRQVYVMRFTTSDLIDHITVFFEDSAAAARFFGKE
jgi:ketosteroid isomerase-like protein